MTLSMTGTDGRTSQYSAEQSAAGGPGSLGAILLQQLDTRPRSPRAVRLRRGQPLYVAGEPGDKVYIVERGWLKSERHTRDGKTSLLDVHVPGDLLGEECLFSPKREDSAVAKQETSVRCFVKDEMLGLVAELGLSALLIGHLSARLELQRELIAQFITTTSEQRLAMRLLMLAHRVGQANGDVLVVRYCFTHEDLAQMVGTTRSRVGFFLKRFEAAGMVRHNRHEFAVHPERTRRFVDLRAA